jgi:hypothetical protein
MNYRKSNILPDIAPMDHFVEKDESAEISQKHKDEILTMIPAYLAV